MYRTIYYSSTKTRKLITEIKHHFSSWKTMSVT
jgi:hypothetical protein